MLWILFIAIPALLVVIVWLDGQLDLHLTTVQEGSMKFVVAGGDYVRTILNMKGKRMSYDNETIVVGSGGGFHALGLHLVSTLWPFRKLHTFSLTTGGLLSTEERKDKPIGDWVFTNEHPKTDRLDVMLRSYFLLPDVELADNFTVNVVIYALLEVVNPLKLVFFYKADVLKMLGSAVLSGYADNLKGKKYEILVAEPKGRGSDFASKICDYINDGGGSKTPKKSLATQYGVSLVETFIYEYALSEDEEVLAATKAKEVERLRAEGVVEKAKGKAAEITAIATAKAQEISIALAAFRETHTDPNTAATAYATMRSTENLPDLNTWVTGGGIVPAVSVNQPARTEKPVGKKEKSR